MEGATAEGCGRKNSATLLQGATLTTDLSSRNVLQRIIFSKKMFWKLFIGIPTSVEKASALTGSGAFSYDLSRLQICSSS